MNGLLPPSQKPDLTVGIVQARMMMAATNLQGRMDLQKECAKFLMNDVKEDFYAK